MEIMKKWREKARMVTQKTSTLLAAVKEREYTPRGLMILFFLALCVGGLTKSLLHNTLTIGFDDYKLAKTKTAIDLNILQKDLIKNGGTLATSGEALPQGQSCKEAENQ